jgi:hypothetical protein
LFSEASINDNWFTRHHPEHEHSDSEPLQNLLLIDHCDAGDSLAPPSDTDIEAGAEDEGDDHFMIRYMAGFMQDLDIHNQCVSFILDLHV